jgi:hypothetical protein
MLLPEAPETATARTKTIIVAEKVSSATLLIWPLVLVKPPSKCLPHAGARQDNGRPTSGVWLARLDCRLSVILRPGPGARSISAPICRPQFTLPVGSVTSPTRAAVDSLPPPKRRRSFYTRKSRFWLAALVLVVTVGLGGAAFAATGGHKAGPL